MVKKKYSWAIPTTFSKLKELILFCKKINHLVDCKDLIFSAKVRIYISEQNTTKILNNLNIKNKHKVQYS